LELQKALPRIREFPDMVMKQKVDYGWLNLCFEDFRSSRATAYTEPPTPLQSSCTLCIQETSALFGFDILSIT
jgi:hypothetical protein